MLKREQNEILTRTGPGTPMGQMLRQFWVPFLTGAELEADGAPVRVTLMGERLLAFRDSEGRVGLIDEFCPHRRASLFFGRNEDCGIRCVYHGWKFDVAGSCVEMPSEPPETDFKHKVRMTAYRVHEAGGLLWAWMGAKDAAVPPPAFDWLDLPADQVYLSQFTLNANFFQGMEGEFDSAHVSFLHRRLDMEVEKTSIVGEYFRNDTAPTWKIDPAPHGLVCAASRRTAENELYWRVTHFALPFYSMVAPEIGGANSWRCWVPLDDTHSWVVTVTYTPHRKIKPSEIAAWQAGHFAHPILEPGTKLLKARGENDYLIDRAVQKAHSFTGIQGTRAQDAAMTESMGGIVDRSAEHLASSDMAIIAIRKAMLDAVGRVAEGEAVEAMRSGDVYAVRSGSALLAPGMPYDQDAPLMREMGLATAAAAE